MGERFSMNTDPIQLVDRGRGLQLSTSRITVMDVFYYLHRGYDFAVIHDIMPSLTREEFDLIAAYVTDHYDELAEEDRRVEEFHQRGIDAQRARGGIFAGSDDSLTSEEGAARLKDRLKQVQAE